MFLPLAVLLLPVNEFGFPGQGWSPSRCPQTLRVGLKAGRCSCATRRAALHNGTWGPKHSSEPEQHKPISVPLQNKLRKKTAQRSALRKQPALQHTGAPQLPQVYVSVFVCAYVCVYVWCVYGAPCYVKSGNSEFSSLKSKQLQILHPTAPPLTLLNGWNKTIRTALYDSVQDYEL